MSYPQNEMMRKDLASGDSLPLFLSLCMFVLLCGTVLLATSFTTTAYATTATAINTPPHRSILDRQVQAAQNENMGDSSDDNTVLASGELGTCIWTIDSEGNLVVSPQEGTLGTLPDWFYPGYPKWHEYAEYIRTARFEGTIQPETCEGLFRDCTNLVQVDFTGLETRYVYSMKDLFEYCSSITSIDLSGLTTPRLTTMQQMFMDCTALKHLDLGTINTRNVKDMRHVFANCYSLEELDVSIMDTSSATDMTGMFYWCKKLSALDLQNFNTSQVTILCNMFHACYSLTNLNVSSFDTLQVKDMSTMFRGCQSLVRLNIASFNTSNATHMSYMFSDCIKLETIIVGDNWTTASATNWTGMFENCKRLLGPLGTIYDESTKYTAAYAWVDTPEHPGYLWHINDVPSDDPENNDNNTGGNSEGSDENPNDVETDNQGKSNVEKSPSTLTTKRISLEKAAITLSRSTFAYDKKIHKPTVRVALSGKQLKLGRDYSVAYPKGCKTLGTYTVIITGKGAYSGTAKTRFTIAPKTPRIRTLAAHKNSDGSSGFIVRWTKATPGKKTSRAVGYELHWSPTKKFTHYARITFKGSSSYAKATKAALLVRNKAWLGKKAYVKIRSYYTVKHTKHYSKWSRVKTVRLKK